MGSALTKMEVMKQVTCESEGNACIAGRAEVKGRMRIQKKKRLQVFMLCYDTTVF